MIQIRNEIAFTREEMMAIILKQQQEAMVMNAQLIANALQNNQVNPNAPIFQSTALNTNQPNFLMNQNQMPINPYAPVIPTDPTNFQTKY